MSAKETIRGLLRKTGYDLCRFSVESSAHARRKRLIEHYEIDTVLDVGANTGQFALNLRGLVGGGVRIVSFEPLSQAFEVLKRNAAGDGAWDVFNYALGERDQEMPINIAGNSVSSSLLTMMPAHVKAAPQSNRVGTETVSVKRLDGVFDAIRGDARNIFMKIDTQGYEDRVLAGAENVLEHIDTIQMEMSLSPLYENETGFTEMLGKMTGRGYRLIGLEPGFADPASGVLLQVDGIFRRGRAL